VYEYDYWLFTFIMEHVMVLNYQDYRCKYELKLHLYKMQHEIIITQNKTVGF